MLASGSIPKTSINRLNIFILITVYLTCISSVYGELSISSKVEVVIDFNDSELISTPNSYELSLLPKTYEVIFLSSNDNEGEYIISSSADNDIYIQIFDINNNLIESNFSNLQNSINCYLNSHSIYYLCIYTLESNNTLLNISLVNYEKIVENTSYTNILPEFEEMYMFSPDKTGSYILETIGMVGITFMNDKLNYISPRSIDNNELNASYYYYLEANKKYYFYVESYSNCDYQFQLYENNEINIKNSIDLINIDSSGYISDKSIFHESQFYKIKNPSDGMYVFDIIGASYEPDIVVNIFKNGVLYNTFSNNNKNMNLKCFIEFSSFDTYFINVSYINKSYPLPSAFKVELSDCTFLEKNTINLADFAPGIKEYFYFNSDESGEYIINTIDNNDYYIILFEQSHIITKATNVAKVGLISNTTYYMEISLKSTTINSTICNIMIEEIISYLMSESIRLDLNNVTTDSIFRYGEYKSYYFDCNQSNINFIEVIDFRKIVIDLYDSNGNIIINNIKDGFDKIIQTYLNNGNKYYLLIKYLSDKDKGTYSILISNSREINYIKGSSNIHSGTISSRETDYFKFIPNDSGFYKFDNIYTSASSTIEIRDEQGVMLAYDTDSKANGIACITYNFIAGKEYYIYFYFDYYAFGPYEIAVSKLEGYGINWHGLPKLYEDGITMDIAHFPVFSSVINPYNFDPINRTITFEKITFVWNSNLFPGPSYLVYAYIGNNHTNFLHIECFNGYPDERATYPNTWTYNVSILNVTIKLSQSDWNSFVTYDEI